ncbi:MAG TPA: hypothetical protein VGA04_17475 [Streptosporangiaceae bacterium]
MSISAIKLVLNVIVWSLTGATLPGRLESWLMSGHGAAADLSRRGFGRVHARLANFNEQVGALEVTATELAALIEQIGRKSHAGFLLA